MKIIMGGGTGFIGRQLVPVLLADGHQLVVVGRDTEKINRLFSGKVEAVSWRDLQHLPPDEYAAVINLSGENIADGRWSAATKAALLSSRVDTTTQFVQWCLRAQVRKPHLYNASAVGYYGLQQAVNAANVTFTEATQPLPAGHDDFSAPLVHQWEHAALAAEAGGVPVTLLRLGVVLQRGEGMLKKLELPAKLGLGAVIGSGKQPIAWIDSQDLVRAVVFLLNHADITGAVNLVAPQCVTQREFTKTFASVLKKPALLWLPEVVVKFMFGQMGQELLLSGQTVVPERLLASHFSFQYATLQSALEHEYPGTA